MIVNAATKRRYQDQDAQRMVAREMVALATYAFAGKKLPKFEPLAATQKAVSAHKVEAGNIALRDWFLRRAAVTGGVRLEG